jgi:hypothetical protein
VILSAGLFVVALVLALMPDLFDAPITTALNRHANRSPLLDSLFLISTPHRCSQALYWSRWFGHVGLRPKR